MWKIRHLDCFAGVWGFALALQQSVWEDNCEQIGFSEIDKFAKKVYSEHFPNSKDLWDITKINIDELEDFDLLTGWFPCQDVSVAWKQNLEWWRTILVEYLLQILEKKQPKYFIFENVKGFMNKKFTKFRESIFNRISEAWYWYDFQILSTKNFWLPQNRERVFIVWCNNISKLDWFNFSKWQNNKNNIKCVNPKKENGSQTYQQDRIYNTNWIAPALSSQLNWRLNIVDFNFPEWKKLTTFLKDILEEEVDEKFYMTLKQYDKLNYESLKRIYEKVAPALDTMQWWHRQPKVLFNKYNNRVMKDISWTIWCHNWFTNKTWYSVCIWYNTRSRDFRNSWFREISPTLCARDYKDPKQVIIIERWHWYFKGTVWPKKILNTVRANIQWNTLLEEKPFRIRKITPTECSRLQGFPDNWSTDFVSNSQAYKQMGNAVSVPVVKSIFDNLLK